MADRARLKLRIASGDDDSGRIVIEEDGGAFTVRVDPPAIGCGGIYPDHVRAYGYAAGLRLVRGWPIDDRTTDAPKAPITRPAAAIEWTRQLPAACEGCPPLRRRCAECPSVAAALETWPLDERAGLFDGSEARAARSPTDA